MGTLLLVIGLILFIGLVVVHELGHFWAARLGGVEAEEFGIFFPPRLYKRKTKKGWLFSVGLLPLGGFVKLKGEHDTDTQPGSFGAAGLAVKSKIMAAGVVMNLVVAYLLFMLLAFIGMPHLVQNQFTLSSDTKYVQQARYNTLADVIEKGSPAAQTGLKSDDAILAIGPSGHMQKLADPSQLPDLTKKYAGQTVQLQFKHKGKTQQKAVTLRSQAAVDAAAKEGKKIGYLGVSVYETQSGLTVTRSTWSAPIVAGGVMGQLTGLTFAGLGKAVAGLAGTVAGGVTHNTAAREAAQTEASSQVSGPVGIFFVFKYGAELGYQFMLMIVAVLSLTLGVMNILPIPALDGGRLWITLIAHALKRPLTERREELINAAGFLFLIGLIVLITIVDVKRFF
jgi:regulator of sigma E protease